MQCFNFWKLYPYIFHLFLLNIMSQAKWRILVNIIILLYFLVCSCFLSCFDWHYLKLEWFYWFIACGFNWYRPTSLHKFPSKYFFFLPINCCDSFLFYCLLFIIRIYSNMIYCTRTRFCLLWDFVIDCWKPSHYTVEELLIKSTRNIDCIFLPIFKILRKINFWLLRN